MSSSTVPETKTYQLGFNNSSQKEWDKLSKPIQLQFALKLQERLNNPHIQKDALSGMPNCYKIKLRSVGYRLVYQVANQKLIITVIAVGKRERNKVYNKAKERLKNN